MKIQRRWNYFVYCALRDKGLCTADKNTYEEKVRENGTVSKTIIVEYEDTDEVKAAINAAFEARGLKREAKPAKVQPEVKAKEVKEEVEETEMSAMFTAEQVAALVLAASKNTTTPVVETVVKEVVPADYETLKKTAGTWQSKYAELEKKYNALVASMKEAKPVEKDALVKAINEPMTEEEVEAWNFPEKVVPSLKEELKKDDDDEDDIFDEEFLAQYAVKTPEKKVTLTHEQRREEARAFMKELLPENNMAWRIDLGGDNIVDSRDKNGLFYPNLIDLFFKVADKNDPHSEVLYKKSNFSKEFEHYELNAEELEDKFHDAKCSDGSYMWDMQTLAFGFVFSKSAYRKYKVEDRF